WHGRSIFTDEQMLTYLKQFERDFADAPQRVIDCTEGGTVKRHAHRQPFAEALAEFATDDAPDLPVPRAEHDAARLEKVIARLESRIEEVQGVRRASVQSIEILRQMLRLQRDPARMQRLFKKLDEHKRRIDGDLKTAFQLVTQLNTVGQFRRAKADRAIAHAAHDDYARQAAQLERDIGNLEVTVEACDEGLKTFRSALDHTRAHAERAAVANAYAGSAPTAAAAA
ncbi:MAG: hypothetical protein AAF078_11595, partial [Planctomycetota bacterium]